MGKIRGTHSSPGIYTQFTDLSYAAKSIGITTLGLVCETQKGPAFEPIAISNWSEFQDYFGGTSTEIFKDSKYPKYEGPYIAKSYLSASDQLYVCRVLGLSGYNAGPAFLITATNADGDKYLVGVLRSRGHYDKYAMKGDPCNGGYSTYDTLVFDCDEVKMEPYKNVYIQTECDSVSANTSDSDYLINNSNFGQFTLVAYKENEEVGRYPVTLNSGSKDYIYNKLGSDPSVGSAAIFVEELYDVYLNDLITSGYVNKISSSVTVVNEVKMEAVTTPVVDLIETPNYPSLSNGVYSWDGLTRKNLGQTFLCDVSGITGIPVEGNTDVRYGYQYYSTSDLEDNGYSSSTPLAMKVGGIYEVKAVTDGNGSRQYVYTDILDTKNNPVSINYTASADTISVVKVLSYDTFFMMNADGDVVTTTNMSDYREEFRCASTPWIVSEIKGDGKNLEVKKLFRFHTITDGTYANTQVKISIANIRPDEGTFDVLVRDFNDSDAVPTVLESYKGLTMVPGTSKYIGLKIGTLDGAYEAKSKYVMVEVVENDMTEQCVPCGFLGYPVRDYSENNIIAPTFAYNSTYDEDISPKKQYFGLTDLTGVDVDMLYYKGKNAYTENYENGYTHPFHLDSRLSILSGKTSIDGDSDTLSLTWDTVSPSQVTGSHPIIGSESEMEDTIYEDVKLRKFTVYPYGGFDGWDIYRGSRTNTDEFKSNKYKGRISNGYGTTFSKITDGTALALSGNCITSDYYAYLAAANQFEIPEKYMINLFATPGIDYVNEQLLSQEILEMIEDKRGDTLYIMTTPDKPWGATDARDEMYTSSEASDNLEDANVDTYYAATYYPWIKYYDKDNSKYINLPPTKDVLRNMADVDNKLYPWYAPAGIERGNVDCTKMHFFAKLEDEDNVYDGRINPLKTFSSDGVKIWGNKTMYTGDTPMNRINTVRLMLYMRKLINEAAIKLIFDPNDTTLKKQFESLINPILAQIQSDRGITSYRLVVSQTAEQMDAHEMSAKIWVKPTPTLEYLEINFVVTPQGVEFED